MLIKGWKVDISDLIKHKSAWIDKYNLGCKHSTQLSILSCQFSFTFLQFPVILPTAFGKKHPFVIYRKQTVMSPFSHKKTAAKLEPFG